MRKLAAVLLCSFVAAAPAFAGEDSTDRWGEGGSGSTIWESPCGLQDFQGNVPMPEKCRPVRARAHTHAPEPAPAPAPAH